MIRCAQSCGLASALLLLLAPVVQYCPAAGVHYEWQQGDSSYQAVERGRIIELGQLSVHDTNDPFGSGTTIFVEPCATRLIEPPQPADDLPCWPARAGERTQQLLGELANRMPEYRSGWVLDAAQYLNRDIG